MSSGGETTETIQNIPNLNPQDRQFLDIIRQQAMQGAGVALGGRPGFFPQAGTGVGGGTGVPGGAGSVGQPGTGPGDDITAPSGKPIPPGSNTTPEGQIIERRPGESMEEYSRRVREAGGQNTGADQPINRAPTSGDMRMFGNAGTTATSGGGQTLATAASLEDAIQRRQELEQEMGLNYGDLHLSQRDGQHVIVRPDLSGTGANGGLEVLEQVGGQSDTPFSSTNPVLRQFGTPGDGFTIAPGIGGGGTGTGGPNEPNPDTPVEPGPGFGGGTGGGGTGGTGGTGGGSFMGSPDSFFTGPLQQTPGEMAQPFMNPFISNVIDPLRGEYDRQRQQATVAGNQQATAAGAFGGSRQGVAEGTRLAELDRQQAKDVANLQMQGFQNALQMGIPFAESQRQLRQQQLQEPLFRQGQALSMLTGALGPVGIGQSQTYQQPGNTGAGFAGGALTGAGIGAAMGGPAAPISAPLGAGIGAIGGGLLGLL